MEVIVATHKMYVMPDDSLYQPLLVGSDFFLNQQKGVTLPKNLILDNTGAHISSKNHNYSELTGLYWLWQNTVKKDTNPDSFYGLVHYRRFLSAKNKKAPLTKTELQNLINLKYEIILPKKRNYYIENLYSHYAHPLHIGPLDRTRAIIKEKYPDFLPEFDRLKTRRSAHMFNIFIFKKPLFEEYCEFLFGILFALESSLTKEELTRYDGFHARFFGRISELLLDVFLYTKFPDLDKRSDVLELQVLELEPVNWIEKISNFLLAKFFGKKYKKSC